MRPSILPLILSASISFLLLPVQAQSGSDPSDQYLSGYTAFERGERLSSAGDVKGAIASFKETRRVLSQIKSAAPSWNPGMVEMRLKRAGEKIVELEGRLARSGVGTEDAPDTRTRGNPGAHGILPGEEIEPPLPPRDSDFDISSGFPPPNPPPMAPGRPGREPRMGNSPEPRTSSSGDPIREIQERMSRLQEDLQTSRTELERLRQEKDDLARQLSESNKVREKAEQTQKVLQGRADMAEEKLAEARTRGAKDGESLHTLQAERDKSKKALRDLQIDREASEEVRQQLATRLTKAQDKVAALTKERDAATKNSAEADARIATAQKKMDVAVADAQKKMDVAIKEKDTLNTKLTQVAKERDDAQAQVVKLREAQKQVDKLVTDNSQLMAKLSDAEKQITQFKAEGEQKEQQISDLKKEVGTVTKQLADVQKQSATYQTQMGDLKGKLDDTSKQLAQMKVDTATSATERKNLVGENELLRGVVLRQMKEQARRDQTRKLVMGELGKMEIRSKDLLTRIDYLGQPVVRLSGKERALFKKPQVEISDSEISLAAPKTDEAEPAPLAAATAEPAPTAITEAAPAAPVVVALAAPVASAPAVVKNPPTKGSAGKVAQAAPAAAPAAPLPENSAPLPEVPATDNIQLASLTTPAPAMPLLAGKDSDTGAKAPAVTGPEGPMSSVDAKTSGVPTEFMPLVQEAKDFFERNDYRSAEKIYEKILAKAPTNLYALSNLGVVRFRSGKLKLAEEAFKKAIAAAPEDAFSHCTLGIVCYSQGKYDEAVNELTKALAINPKNATAHNYLGITASQKGWQEAAQKELETATALDPGYADAHFNLAVVFATQQPPNKENARKHYKRATELGAEVDSALEALLK